MTGLAAGRPSPYITNVYWHQHPHDLDPKCVRHESELEHFLVHIGTLRRNEGGPEP